MRVVPDSDSVIRGGATPAWERLGAAAKGLWLVPDWGLVIKSAEMPKNQWDTWNRISMAITSLLLPGLRASKTEG